ncbi:hypothetical protein K1W69_21600 [Hoeflea sp. WL0058]|uniref:Uncharacterized protein n=1 Tax=Flavimaribacter sediminis TaxID=2865987 RepID=A0AAE3D2G9_9HYPH|nr:hypothetical protein [Flavimaribacter sediminis]MBW8639804.1 hypothetical protein [Flavimaribacter sediminis]
MSLKHLSLNAEEPQRVAMLLATLLGGEALPFPPFPDSWIAFSGADDGSAIEVYPNGHRLKAGPDRIECYSGQPDRNHSFVHAAFGSPLTADEILAAAKREGWLSRLCDRGPFRCIEIWLENRILVEVLDPDMQKDYREGMTIGNWKAMFGLE